MAWSSPTSPESPTPDAAFALARSSKTSIVEERRSENWSGLRIGVNVLVVASCEGKMEMCSGLFCFFGFSDCASGWKSKYTERGGGTHVAADDAQASDGGDCGRHGCRVGEFGS